METPASSSKLRANAPEGWKRFPIRQTREDLSRETVSRYGRFIEDGDCFELRSEPPRSWRNVHYTDQGEYELFSEVSYIGDGRTHLRTPAGQLVTLCPYEQKYLYIRDDV